MPTNGRKSGGGADITPNERFVLVLGYTILAMWVASFVLEWQIPESYDPPAALNPAMMVIVGSIFAGKTVAATRKNNGNNGRREDA